MKRLGPTKADWFMVVVSALFTAGGIVIAVGKGEKSGIAVAAFFGGCLAISVWMVASRIWTKQSSRAISVEVCGGVPIRSSKRSGLIVAAGLAAVGLTGGWAGGQIGLAFVVISYLMGALGASLLLLLSLGVLPRPYIQFDPDGLRFGQRRSSYLLEWDNIARVAPGDTGGHDTVLIVVRDVARLVETVDASGSRELARSRLAKRIQSNRSWFGCDLAIMPFQFGFDMALLVGAIMRYVADVGARQSLARKIPLP